MAGNAAATAQKIMASEVLFRSGIVGDLIMHLCDVPLTLIMYILLKPVSKNLRCSPHFSVCCRLRY